jgi:hypothetical protein
VSNSGTAGWCLPSTVPTFGLDTRATRFLSPFLSPSAPVPFGPTLRLPLSLSRHPTFYILPTARHHHLSPHPRYPLPPNLFDPPGSQVFTNPPPRSSFLYSFAENTTRDVLLRALPFARGIGPATVSSYGPSSLAHSRHIHPLLFLPLCLHAIWRPCHFPTLSYRQQGPRLRPRRHLSLTGRGLRHLPVASTFS